MSHLNVKPAGVEPAGSGGRDAGKSSSVGCECTTFAAVVQSPLRKRRRLDPQAGALIKLDSVELRLQAARAAKDDDAWGRYYLAWVKLHRVAFGGEL